MRTAWLLAFTAGCSQSAAIVRPSGVQAPAAAVEAHGSSGHTAISGQTREAQIMGRFRDVMNGLPPGAVAERGAVSDLAYPRDEDENTAMAGYGLMLITSITRTPDELPLAQVKVHSRAGDMPLGRTARKRMEVSDSGVRATFGDRRTDELYYFPIAFTRLACSVLVDFAANRTNLEVMTFPPPPDADHFPSNMSIKDPGNPDLDAATAMAKREFGWDSGQP